MDMTLLLLIGLPVIALALGFAAGFLYSGPRFYNDGYNDGLADAAEHSVSAVAGECGACGWEPPYGTLSQMLEAILEHSTRDCPAKRY